MKVIFLDIDGVLNSEEWAVRRFEEMSTDAIENSYPYGEFDKKLVVNLNKIVRETNAKVVISSSWRQGRTMEELQKILDNKGFIGEVIDMTPCMGAPLGFGYTVPRGCEIDWWLEQKGKFQRINWSVEEQLKYEQRATVKNYVILDDDSDMLYNQREHFVRTSWKFGLTEDLADLAIKILNTPLKKLYYNDVSDT